MKKQLILSILIGASSFLQANYTDNNQVEYNGLTQDKNQQGNQLSNDTENSDQKLKQQIQDSLENYFLNKYDDIVVYGHDKYIALQSYFLNLYNNVVVVVNKGYVTLRGSVATKEDRDALEKNIRGIDGVRDVQNEVTVLPQEKQGQSQQDGSFSNNSSGRIQNSDQKLTKKIQDSLQDYFSQKYNNVVVFINKGFITLQSYFSNKYSNVIVRVNDGYVTLNGSVATKEDRDALEQKIRKMKGVRDVRNNITIDDS